MVFVTPQRFATRRAELTSALSPSLTDHTVTLQYNKGTDHTVTLSLGMLASLQQKLLLLKKFT